MTHAEIIDSYARLPIGLYLDIVGVSRSDMDELDKQVRILALLAGKSEAEILALPIATYKEHVAAASFLGQPCKEGRIASSYKVGGFTLVPTTDIAKITAAQYIDFQTLSREGDAKTVELCSVFLIPKGCKYNDEYDIADVQRAIREGLTVQDVISLAAFFLTEYVASIRSSLTYCNRTIRRLKDPKARAAMEARLAETEAMRARLLSMSGGDGSRTSTGSARPAGSAGTTPFA